MRTFTTALCLAITLVGLGLMLDAAERAGPPNVAGFLWPVQPQVQPFVLDDARGGSLDQETLRGHWTLLFLGYTHCPDICPTTLDTLKATNAALAASAPWAASGQVLFISVDAERDTPARLKQYVGHFNPAFLAATGTAAQLHLVTTQLDMRYTRSSAEDPSQWWYDHSAHIVLISPALRIVALFEPPHVAADLAERVRTLLNYLTDPARHRAP